MKKQDDLEKYIAANTAYTMLEFIYDDIAQMIYKTREVRPNTKMNLLLLKLRAECEKQKEKELEKIKSITKKLLV